MAEDFSVSETYTVKQGDHISKIAEKFGFCNFQTIWSDANNTDLRAQRVDPHVLLPGDQIYIPDKRGKTMKGHSTSRLHMFVVDQPQLLLRLAIVGFDNEPLRNKDCELEIDKAIFKHQTDGDGMFQQEIPRSAIGGVLRIPDLDYEFPVKVGELDPPDEETGWRGRLINLGYHAGPLDNPDKLLLQYAIEEFQCDHEMKVTGLLDDGTRDKLKEKHGG